MNDQYLTVAALIAKLQEFPADALVRVGFGVDYDVRRNRLIADVMVGQHGYPVIDLGPEAGDRFEADPTYTWTGVDPARGN